MTARLAHLSDIHVDGRGRLDDLCHVLDAFREDIRNRGGVDLVLVSGDIYERRSTPEERSFFAEFLQQTSELAPIVGVRGNHDAEGDVDILNRLETLNPVKFFERPTAAPGSAWVSDLMEQWAEPFRFRVLALPWIEKSRFAATLAPSASSEEVSARGIAAIRELLTCLRAEASRVRSAGFIPVLCAHVMLGGSVVSTGQMLIGQGLELSPNDLLDIGCEYAACGHIHKTQEFLDGKVAYAGSPTRQNFGETEPKGYRLVTFDDDGRFVSNEFVELPSRQIVLIDCDWSTSDAAGDLTVNGVEQVVSRAHAQGCARDALVRFRFRINKEDTHLVDVGVIERMLRADGAHEIQIERFVVAETRARVPEIAKVDSLNDKLTAYFEAKSVEVDAGQWERLAVKTAAVTEVRA